MARVSPPAAVDPMQHLHPDARVQVLLISPLFEEANRMRRTLWRVAHLLADAGFGVCLPDLPAQGESMTPLGDHSFQDWTNAVAAHAIALRTGPRTLVIAAFRAGALFDTAGPSDGIWRLAEETGARLLRDIDRRQLARPRSADHPDADTEQPIPPLLRHDLERALPQPAAVLRTVRLHQDALDADGRIDGAPLWRRPEPDEDPQLTAAIVADLTQWIIKCAG